MNAESLRRAVGTFDKAFGGAEEREERLLGKVKRFELRLMKLATVESHAEFSRRHELAKLTDQLKSAIRDVIRGWTERLAKAAPVRKLSKKYKDRAILLVFGKVNSGKSTFVNFLVNELHEAGARIRRFAIEGGKDVKVAGPFQVGTTETTARIQGVEVDDRLVLLDSPGLHSVTNDNHERTQLFTDSADAVLWLSSSSSPGQVQELHDLKAELERNRPLLPVITKSDERVEEWCETTESITAEMRNKPCEVRREQEEDVLSRTRQLGLKAEIRTVTSISIYSYEEAGRSDVARTEAGLDRLYECLVGIVDAAKGYKVRKAEHVARNYINDHVLPSIGRRVAPRLDDLIDRSAATIRELDGSKRQQLKDEVESEATAEIARIVDRHRDSKNKQAIVDDLSAFVTPKLADAIRQEFERYVGTVAEAVVPLVSLSVDEIDDFADISIEFEQETGAAARSIFTSIGSGGAALAGAALGTAVLPGIGTIVGGLLASIGGGLAGDRVGELFADTEIVSEKVGVSTEALEKSSLVAIHRRIVKYVDSAMDALIDTIRSTSEFATEVRREVDRFEKEIGKTALP